MTERPCIRCQHPVVLDEGQLVYCSHCGSPQIFLSEELLEQTAADTQRYSEQVAAVTPTPAEAEAQKEALPGVRQRNLRRQLRARQGRWPLAVEYALLAGGLALCVDAVGMAFGPILLIAWLWMVSAPMLVVGFYNGRTRGERISAGFAARLGLLTALLVSIAGALALTGSFLITRFALHSPEMDTAVATAIAQLQTNAQSQYGTAAEQMVRLLSVPEYRVGMLLWVGTLSVAIYLILSAATAGLAGLFLARRRPV